MVRDQMYYACIRVTFDFILQYEGRRPRSKSEASNKYLTKEQYLEVELTHQPYNLCSMHLHGMTQYGRENPLVRSNRKDRWTKRGG